MTNKTIRLPTLLVELVLNIYNIIGQIVNTQKISVDANNYSLNIDQNGKFTSGLFIVQAEINGEVKRLKMIVE